MCPTNEKISVDVSFGKFGAFFFCTNCKKELVGESDELLHKSVTGVFRKRPINCKFAGKRFKNPFRGMELEQVP